MDALERLRAAIPDAARDIRLNLQAVLRGGALRLVAGPAYRGVVERSDSLWIIGVDGPLPPTAKPGFGVLVLDLQGKARGVMLYEGPPVENAPAIGTVSVGAASLPLIGIQLDPARIEDPRCPFFPDSVTR